MDIVNEVWMDVSVVEFHHRVDISEFVGASKTLNQRLQLPDDGGGVLVKLEVFLDLHSKQPCLRFLLQFGLSHCETDIIIIFVGKRW